MENTSKAVTLGFVVSIPRGEVWLAKKKTKLCADRYNGYGGSVEPEESIEDCMVREFHEESRATTTDRNLTKVGVIDFYSADEESDPALICKCHIFLITDHWGLMDQTKEMGEPIPFYFNRLPFDEMMPSDRLWLPRVLEGKIVSGSITFDVAMKNVIDNNLQFE